jgi:hypothetical protein
MNYNFDDVEHINKQYDNIFSNFCLSDDESDNDNEYNDDKKNKEQNALFIHDNFDTMNLDDKKTLMNKLITSKQINRFLLRYELKHLKLNKLDSSKTSLKEFASFIMSYITRYQGVASGFYIDDKSWIIKKTSHSFIFQNTIDTSDVDDNDTEYFLDYIIDKLGNLCDKYDVAYNIEADEEDTDISIIEITISSDEKFEDEIRL